MTSHNNIQPIEKQGRTKKTYEWQKAQIKYNCQDTKKMIKERSRRKTIIKDSMRQGGVLSVTEYTIDEISEEL